MSLILVVRHATAAEAGPGYSDFDRELTATGREEAGQIGETLVSLGLTPDLALFSPAARTRQTLECLSEHLPRAIGQTRSVDRLYSGTWHDYLEAVSTSGAETLLIVGHNPMVGEFALNLAGGGDSGALAQLRRGFRKAAMAVFRFDGPLVSLSAGSAMIEAVHQHRR